MSTPEERAVLVERPGLGPPEGDREAVRVARRERFRLLLRSKTFLAGVLVVGAWAVCAIFAPLVAPYDPLGGNLAEEIGNRLQAPSLSHPFGTDQLGRDVLSRVIAGARDILTVAPLAALLGTVLGTIIGLLAGYFRGAVDEVIMRPVDAFLAIPPVIMGLVVLTALGPSKWALVVVIGILFAPIIGRTVRAAVLAERELEYVEAARLRNERSPYIMFAEILPNVSAPILVEFTVRLGYAVFTAATLSFLGFGVQPPAPDWGLQIQENYITINAGFWWGTLFPALAIASLVVGVNMIADGLARVLER
ncbi:MAG TPA: ABC transporter permease [Gaiellaceae bacterium]|nr:ABC transporter permease [Gaiellaceae bacterium]